MRYFGTWCPFGSRSGIRKGKRGVSAPKSKLFWRSFWHFFGIFADVFLGVFSCALIFRTWGGLGAQGCQKVRFWEVLLMPFLGQGQKVKIDVLCRRQPHLEGSGGSENRWNLRRFLEGVKSAPLGGTFRDFLDFWCPIGGWKGSILAKKGIFFEAWFFDAFWCPWGIHFWRGRRH